nr:MAG TPA: hypothetical protein [Caudoviricetes sp.]
MRDEVLRLIDMIETVYDTLNELNVDVTISSIEHKKLCELAELCDRIVRGMETMI